MNRLLLFFAALIISCAIHAQSTGPFSQPGRIGNFTGVPNGLCNSGRDIGIDTASQSLYLCGPSGWSLVSSAIDCKDATGSTVAYTCPAPSIAPIAYKPGLLVVFVPQTTNTTTTPTINVAGLGVNNLKASASTALTVGALVGGNPYLFEYDGTQFVQTGGGSSGGTGTVTSVTIAGTTRQITVTGTCTITTSGTCTLSLPSNLLFPGTPTFTASTTGGASYNLPSGVAPTSPNSGDFWNLSGVLQFYNGTTTKSIATSDQLSASVTGIRKSAGAGSTDTAAVASDIVGLFSTCSGTQYLGADGACHTASGGSPGGGAGQIQTYATSTTFGGQSFVIGGSLLTTTTFQRGVECATATIPYTSIQTGALTNSLAINASMPQKFRFDHMYLVESTQFVGTSVTSMTVSAGTSGTYTDVIPNFSLLVSGGQNNWYDRPAPPSFGTSTWNFVLYFTSVGANLSALTAGNLYVEVCGYAVQ